VLGVKRHKLGAPIVAVLAGTNKSGFVVVVVVKEDRLPFLRISF
jgi:hypothetical protein